MSVDHFYMLNDGKWNQICTAELSEFRSDYWVDACHGSNTIVDERYYFPDLASALEFYTEGWKERQYCDDNGQPFGLDHIGLYSRGRLIHGRSIHMCIPGHEGESLRGTLDKLARHFEEDTEL